MVRQPSRLGPAPMPKSSRIARQRQAATEKELTLLAQLIDLEERMTEYELRREQIAASIDMAREALAKEKYKDVARLLETAHIIVSNELEMEARNEQRKETL